MEKNVLTFAGIIVFNFGSSSAENKELTN